MTAVPQPQDRGAFMGINASIQQLSGGVAAFVAGKIVVQNGDGPLGNYPMLGYVVLGSMVITIFMMWRINKQVAHKLHQKPLVPPTQPVEEVATEVE